MATPLVKTSSEREEKTRMEKDNPIDNSSGICEAATVHMVLHGKGGRKNVVARWVAEFSIKFGKPVRSIERDPVNRSLGPYKALSSRNRWRWWPRTTRPVTILILNLATLTGRRVRFRR